MGWQLLWVILFDGLFKFGDCSSSTANQGQLYKEKTYFTTFLKTNKCSNLNRNKKEMKPDFKARQDHFQTILFVIYFVLI